MSELTPLVAHREERTARYVCGFDTSELPQRSVDLLVVGSGIAGLTAALLAPEDMSVLVVTKSGLSDTGTGFAQGGIAGPVGEEDSTGLHFEDTLRAGDGLCDRAAVAVLVTEARDAVEWLIEMGADFERLGGRIALAREGGHSLPRILYAGDTTGSEIQSTLTKSARECERLRFLEGRFLIDLLTFDGRAVGALFEDMKTKEREVVWASSTVLATGGAGRLYVATTNPPISTGDGLAVAYRAGVELRDLEFVQFHPTALDTQENPRFLISEALRGEGAVLLDCEERRFMVGRHPQADLAPRDVVVRGMVDAMRECGTTHVWLDARGLGREKLEKRFPAIYARCKEGGFDLATQLVPVRPAAHYMVGGITVDIDGQTSLPGLYASGECASTGVHGANRLASNSLLEGLVFSRRIVRQLAKGPEPRRPEIRNPPSEDGAGIPEGRVQTIMSEGVGVVRDRERLLAAMEELGSLSPGNASCGQDVSSIESYNLLTLADLVTASALIREETRGTHYRSDFPERNDQAWTKRIVHRRGMAPFEVTI
jgi:L-aspartate oxidase